MAMREKLIELIREAKFDVDRICVERDWCDGCPAADGEGNCKEVYIADHLIANGVTIPVRCHECKHWKNEINGCTEDKRFCDIGFYMVHKDGFCSFGEKK